MLSSVTPPGTFLNGEVINDSKAIAKYSASFSVNVKSFFILIISPE